MVANFSDLTAKIGFKPEKTEMTLIKPNVCGMYHPSLQLMSAVIEFTSSKTESVVIGETQSMLHTPQEQYERLRYTHLLEQFPGKLRMVDLSEDELVKIPVPNPRVLDELKLPRMVVDSDMLINVPKIGSHPITTITGALKNLFGLLPERRKSSTYHHLGMDNVIADISRVVKPELNVLEAKSNIVLGVDPLTVDIVGCRFVGYDPLEVDHFKLIAKERGFEIEDFIEKIKVLDF